MLLSSEQTMYFNSFLKAEATIEVRYFIFLNAVSHINTRLIFWRENFLAAETMRIANTPFHFIDTRSTNLLF